MISSTNKFLDISPAQRKQLEQTKGTEETKTNNTQPTETITNQTNISTQENIQKTQTGNAIGFFGSDYQKFQVQEEFTNMLKTAGLTLMPNYDYTAVINAVEAGDKAAFEELVANLLDSVDAEQLFKSKKKDFDYQGGFRNRNRNRYNRGLTKSSKEQFKEQYCEMLVKYFVNMGSSSNQSVVSTEELKAKKDMLIAVMDYDKYSTAKQLEKSRYNVIRELNSQAQNNYLDGDLRNYISLMNESAIRLHQDYDNQMAEINGVNRLASNKYWSATNQYKEVIGNNPDLTTIRNAIDGPMKKYLADDNISVIDPKLLGGNRYSERATKFEKIYLNIIDAEPITYTEDGEISDESIMNIFTKLEEELKKEIPNGNWDIDLNEFDVKHYNNDSCDHRHMINFSFEDPSFGGGIIDPFATTTNDKVENNETIKEESQITTNEFGGGIVDPFGENQNHPSIFETTATVISNNTNNTLNVTNKTETTKANSIEEKYNDLYDRHFGVVQLEEPSFGGGIIDPFADYTIENKKNDNTDKTVANSEDKQKYTNNSEDTNNTQKQTETTKANSIEEKYKDLYDRHFGVVQLEEPSFGGGIIDPFATTTNNKVENNETSKKESQITLSDELYQQLIELILKDFTLANKIDPSGKLADRIVFDRNISTVSQYYESIIKLLENDPTLGGRL